MTRYERKLFFERLVTLRDAYRAETQVALDLTVETRSCCTPRRRTTPSRRPTPTGDSARDRPRHDAGRLTPTALLPQRKPRTSSPGLPAVQAPSSLATHAASTRAQASTSASGTGSSAPCASRTSPGPKITHGVSPSLTNRRMSAPYGTPTSEGRSPVTRAATPASPAGSGWSGATRAVANLAPVISTEAGWSRRNGCEAHASAMQRRELLLRLVGRLAQPDAVAALGDDAVHDGRRPLAAHDRADDRRVREPEGRHQRVGLLRVPARLVGLEGADEVREVVERRHALATGARVRGATRDGEPERDRAGVGDDDVEAGRLRDHAGVAGRAGADRRERPLAAVLLGRDEGDEQLAGERRERARRRERPHGTEDRGDAALHVARAAAVQAAVADLAGPRVGGPGRGSPGGHDVHVRRQDQPPAAGRPARPSTTGSVVRGTSSPGQAGSSRIAAGSGWKISTSRPSASSRSASRAWSVASSPVTLGVRTSAEVLDQRRRVHGLRGGARAAADRAVRSCAQHRPGEAGHAAGPVPADLAERDRVDLAARCLEAASRDRVAVGDDHDARAAPRARCSRASRTPPRAPRPAGRRGPGAAHTARRAAAAGTRPRRRPRPARSPTAGGRARPGPSSTARRTRGRRRRRSPRAAGRRRRWSAATARCTAGRAGARRCRRPRSSPAPRSGRGSGSRGPASMPRGRRARRRGSACPGRSGMAPPSATSSGSNT